jgi:hypothetical protein
MKTGGKALTFKDDFRLAMNTELKLYHTAKFLRNLP